MSNKDGLIESVTENIKGVFVYFFQSELVTKRMEKTMRLIKSSHDKLSSDGYNINLSDYIKAFSENAKISIPIFNYSTLENNNEKLDLWSNVLANSSIPDNNIEISTIEILKGLNPLDVKILKFIFNETLKKEDYYKESTQETQISNEYIKHHLTLQNVPYKRSIYNLMLYTCIEDMSVKNAAMIAVNRPINNNSEFSFKYLPKANENQQEDVKKALYDMVRITPIGYDLVNAVSVSSSEKK